MINGNAGDFVDRMYSCQDTVFIYNGVKYWFEGYMPSSDTVHMEVVQVDPEREVYVWEYNGISISEGQESFQKAPIFDGKTFWEAESRSVDAVIVLKFSNHSLRHTFITRMCEAGVSIKAMQEILGHEDAETTMDIYTAATEDLKKSELTNFQEYFIRIVKGN